MSINNISNNNSAQLQVYAQEKSAAATNNTAQREANNAQTNRADSVQISERARALLEKETAVSTQGNGGGIIPPGNAPASSNVKDSGISTLGNGEGIEPPKTVKGNGEGIEPPKTVQGNGEGIEPPKL